jgi:hypothetical protein
MTDTANPTPPDDPVSAAFIAVTAALWELPDHQRERVLRATAILLGFDFLEDERAARRRR